jgi:hypothetical protein
MKYVNKLTSLEDKSSQRNIRSMLILRTSTKLQLVNLGLRNDYIQSIETQVQMLQWNCKAFGTSLSYKAIVKNIPENICICRCTAISGATGEHYVHRTQEHKNTIYSIMVVPGAEAVRNAYL